MTLPSYSYMEKKIKEESWEKNKNLNELTNLVF